MLSSCGKDGIYGNDDDEIEINYPGGGMTCQRHELYPLEKEKKEKAANAAKKNKTYAGEMVLGQRPQGNCSLAGKVVSAETGKPIAGARMYLHYRVTHGSIFVNTAEDGTFEIQEIPTGPYSFCMSHSPGYQDAIYNPENRPGPWPAFSLQEGEHRADIVLTAKQACRISGKVTDEKGQIPENIEHLTVLAWFQRPDGKGSESQQALVDQNNGTYSIDGLDNKPVYVMAIDWRAARKGNAPPPIYYPGVFSRSDAKQITFDKSPKAEGIDITIRKNGGLVLEGTVRDKEGKPVPEAFVVAHHRDLLFDFNTADTDEQGHYRIEGMGDGEVLVHVDAVHRGLARVRTPITLSKDKEKNQLDFTLPQGVTISGKFVDDKGADWQIGTSFGFANIMKDPKELKNQKEENSGSFSLTNFWNKHRPADAADYQGGSFELGQGSYQGADMHFPTKSTFLIQGMMPGKTLITFLPNKEGHKVVKILYDGKDIMQSGLVTKPGEEIKDVTVVMETH
jgi:hypothetical protein